MTPGSLVDLVLLALLVGSAVAGWHRGGLRLAGSAVGLVGGLAIGLALVPHLTVDVRGTAGWALTVVGVVLAAAFGMALGRQLGALLAGVLARLHLSLLDRVAGAAGGVLLGFVVVGLALTLAPASPGAWVGQARSSTLGSAAADVADRALDAVHGHRAADLPLPAGVR